MYLRRFLGLRIVCQALEIPVESLGGLAQDGSGGTQKALQGPGKDHRQGGGQGHQALPPSRARWRPIVSLSLPSFTVSKL